MRSEVEVLVKVRVGLRIGGVVVMEGGVEVVFEELAVFGDTAGDAFAPHAEAGGFEGAAHEVDDLFFGEAGAFFDFLEAGAVFPRETDDV